MSPAAVPNYWKYWEANMSNAERHLAEAFAADMPPAADHAFTFAVLERIERRRAWTDAMELVPYIIAAAALLWILAPTIDDLVQKTLGIFNTPAFLSAAVLTLAALMFLGLGRVREVLEL